MKRKEDRRFVIEKKFVKIPSLESVPSKSQLVRITAKPLMQVKIAPSHRDSGDFEEVNIDGAAKTKTIVAARNAQKFLKTGESIIVFMCKTCNVYFPTRQQLESHNNSVHVKKHEKSSPEKAKPALASKKKVRNIEDRIYFSGYFKEKDGTFQCQFCPFSSAIRTTVSSHAIRKHSMQIKGIEHETVIPDVEEQPVDVPIKQEEDDDFYWPIETLDDEEIDDSGKTEQVSEEVMEAEEANDALDSVKSCQFCSFQTMDNSVYCEHVKENHRESWLKSLAPRGSEIVKEEIDEKILKKCKFCSYKTLQHSSLQAHYRKTHANAILRMNVDEAEVNKDVDLVNVKGQKLRTCPYCSFETYVTSTFNSHVTRLHMHEKSGRRTIKKQSATQHTGYACNYCSFVAASVPSLKIHTVREHAEATQPFCEVPVPEFDCDQCEFKTTNRRTMQHHSRNLHKAQTNEEGMFTCGACSYETESRMGLQRHVSIKHFKPRRQGSSNHPLYECDQCKFQSFNTWIIEWHMKKHNPEGEQDGVTYSCDDCNYSTWAKSLLFTHIHRRHRTVAGLERVPRVEANNEENPDGIQCKHCDYTTKNKHVMKVHVIRKHTEIYNHECKECGKKYKVKADLTNHIRFQHREQPIMCDVCGKTCRNSNLLYLHQKFHHYKPEFECPVCHRHLSTQANLDDHIHKQHEQQQDYVCEECGKKFNKVARLKIHMRVHTGVKPYTCKICCRAFARRNGLRQHLLIHTGKKPYTCDICSKTFTQKTGLISHRKSHPGNHPPLPRVTIDHVLSDLLNEPDLNE